MPGIGITARIQSERYVPDRDNGSIDDRIASGPEKRDRASNPKMDQPSKLKVFEEIILPHLNAAYNLARWLTRNEDDAQDVVQEAYLRAFRFFDGYKGGDGKSWLLAVVRNTCFTWLRHEHREMTNEPFDEMAHSSNRQALSQEETLVDASEMTVLRNCIEMLPLDFREVLVMRELEEMSYQQISAITCLPIGTVMSRLSRARKRLGECACGSKMRKDK
jgi:RNA polymerase sigma-70 factor (ECF subfamily)